MAYLGRRCIIKMAKETRLRIAKEEYAKGNTNHPYVLEFLSELKKNGKKK